MKIKTLLLITLAAVAFAACNSSGDDPTAGVQFTDMMTLTKMTDDGAVLTYVPENDGANITYTTTTVFQKDVYSEGMRIMAIYKPLTTDQWGVPGPIQVKAAAPTLGKGHAPVVAIGDTLNNWKSDPMANAFIWRTGNYVNLAFEELFSPTPEKFACYVDAKTLDSSYPELHIVYTLGRHYEERSYQLYASYNIADLWNRVGVKGICVYYNGPSGLLMQQFDKTGFRPAE